MKIILCEDVTKVGSAGETKEVADGFARNYLFPRNLALPATAGNLRRWESEKRVREIRLSQSVESARKLAETLNGLALEVQAKAGREGHLFGAITGAMVRDALLAKGFSIDKKNIQIESPIKALGDYEVPVRLHAQVTATLQLKVTGSQPESRTASV